ATASSTAPTPKFLRRSSEAESHEGSSEGQTSHALSIWSTSAAHASNRTSSPPPPAGTPPPGQRIHQKISYRPSLWVVLRPTSASMDPFSTQGDTCRSGLGLP